MATSSRIRVTSPAPGSTRTVPRRLPESVYVPGSLTSNHPLELSRSIDALSADSVAKAATEQSEQARIAAKTEASSFFMMLYLLLSRCFRLRSQHERQVEILSANRFLHRIFAYAQTVTNRDRGCGARGAWRVPGCGNVMMRLSARAGAETGQTSREAGKRRKSRPTNERKQP